MCWKLAGGMRVAVSAGGGQALAGPWICDLDPQKLALASLLAIAGTSRWSAEKMDYALREDDFLFHKLGLLKPHKRQPVYYRPLTDQQVRRTVKYLCGVIRKEIYRLSGAGRTAI